MTHYGFVIDSKSCISCHSCAVACKVENNLPDSIWWNRILTDGGPNMDTPAGTYPNLTIRNIPMGCQHCENPACVKVCPVGATYQDPETGVVRQDYDKCIGCRMCMSACPYTGVRSFNWEEPQYAIGQPMGSLDIPQHQKQVVEKCTMCWHRLAQGEKPACIEPCPARIRFWGDFDDPSSEVSQLIREREYMQLLPEQGTRPSVYYLV
ncbi:4Fe-4S dicluster domain-containing protein [Adlercreutzia faecimuris]|uniref:4Fe-4S dicluster domain-containing protein n=1 Tax=Adlercreutzia faecimuris TaxID=2897341 RepID=A0ABS9WHT4_9ACTN|nr:4Fe-4S dicluster domain-containing protein [Adlercreutzia sp. JBNU-10]MCI2242438.1 4Fe-4S dicluster domain-containing protein [Adlercreutzia sp. JBNU-10]